MNYRKVYNQIIERAKKENRKKGYGIYYEKHHITPKCLGGSNDKKNLVLLTGREHFLAHWLLHRIYPNNSSLALAFFRCAGKNTVDKKFTPSSRSYSEAREAFSITNSKNKKGWIYSKERNKRISVWQKSNKKECEHCHRLFNPLNYIMYHGDLCKDNPLITLEQCFERLYNAQRGGEATLGIKNKLKIAA